jgi:hypothetical protein
MGFDSFRFLSLLLGSLKAMIIHILACIVNERNHINENRAQSYL